MREREGERQRERKREKYVCTMTSIVGGVNTSNEKSVIIKQINK